MGTKNCGNYSISKKNGPLSINRFLGLFYVILNLKTMKKYILTCFLTLSFIGFATAQLTIQKMESSRKITFPAGSLIEIKLPTKTSRTDCNCFESYKGYLQLVEKDAVEIILTEEKRESVDDNKAAFQEFKTYEGGKTPTLARVPLTNVLAINRYSENVEGLQKLGGVFLFLSIINNLFIAPHTSGDFGTVLRNIGYGGIAFGLTTFVIPTKRTYYIEQPKKQKKTLWKLRN
jgi:hypothetical protein